MSYINVTIYDDADKRLRQHLLEAERKFWADEADRLRLQLENIPAAIEKWGRVTITGRNVDVTLVAKPDEEPAP